MNYEILQHECCFQGYFRIDRYQVRFALFQGGTADISREVFERGHAVAVLPYDPVHDRVVLIEQFRIGAHCAGKEPWLLEPVAGIIEDGESAQEVAQREGQEEAGCNFQQLIPMYEYLVSPGGSSETVSLFCGLIDSRDLGGIHGLVDEGENIKVHVLTREQALNALQTGRAANAMTIIALQWLQAHYQALIHSHRM